MKKLASAALIVAAAITLVVGIFTQIYCGSGPAWLPPPQEQLGTSHNSPPAVVAADRGDGSTRAVYPHSVVVGGVHDAGEAKSAAATDPAVADHYHDIHLDSLHVKRVPAERSAYVSYRIGDEIYWTKRPVKLHPGEALLSDGSNEIRARCGNRVSDTARFPVSEDEPSPEVLDHRQPDARAALLPSQGVITADEVAPLGGTDLSDRPRLASPDSAVFFGSGPPEVLPARGAPGGGGGGRSAYYAPQPGGGGQEITQTFEPGGQRIVTSGTDTRSPSDGAAGDDDGQPVPPDDAEPDDHPTAGSFVAFDGADVPVIGGDEPPSGPPPSLLPPPTDSGDPRRIGDLLPPGDENPPGDDLENLATVPEPGTLVLVAGTLAGSAVRWRRRVFAQILESSRWRAGS